MRCIAYNVPRVGDAALARCAEPPYEARPSTAAKRGAQALTRCYMPLSREIKDAEAMDGEGIYKSLLNLLLQTRHHLLRYLISFIEA